MVAAGGADEDEEGGAGRLGGVVSIRDVLLAIQTDAPNARIFVSGYPKLLGTKATNALGCQVNPTLPIYIESPDVRFIRSKATELNAAIRHGVRQASRLGIDAHYVEVASRFAGHNVDRFGIPGFKARVECRQALDAALSG